MFQYYSIEKNTIKSDIQVLFHRGRINLDNGILIKQLMLKSMFSPEVFLEQERKTKFKLKWVKCAGR